MDIEKLLAKQRKLDHSRSNEPISSGEDKGTSTGIVAAGEFTLG